MNKTDSFVILIIIDWEQMDSKKVYLHNPSLKQRRKKWNKQTRCFTKLTTKDGIYKTYSITASKVYCLSYLISIIQF